MRIRKKIRIYIIHLRELRFPRRDHSFKNRVQDSEHSHGGTSNGAWAECSKSQISLDIHHLYMLYLSPDLYSPDICIFWTCLQQWVTKHGSFHFRDKPPGICSHLFRTHLEWTKQAALDRIDPNNAFTFC